MRASLELPVGQGQYASAARSSLGPEVRKEQRETGPDGRLGWPSPLQLGLILLPFPPLLTPCSAWWKDFFMAECCLWHRSQSHMHFNFHHIYSVCVCMCVRMCARVFTRASVLKSVVAVFKQDLALEVSLRLLRKCQQTQKLYQKFLAFSKNSVLSKNPFHGPF